MKVWNESDIHIDNHENNMFAIFAYFHIDFPSTSLAYTESTLQQLYF